MEDCNETKGIITVLTYYFNINNIKKIGSSKLKICKNISRIK